MSDQLGNWQGAKVPEAIRLEGRFVTLEPLRAERHSAELWNAVQGADQVWTWLADGPYSEPGGLAAAIREKETGSAARFFAILPKRANGAASEGALGYASLMRIDAPNGVIEVGNVLFAPLLQRTPAATEAMFLMARHVFEDLGYRRYEWKCNARNVPSRRAAERLGFTFEGVFRQHMIVKGRSRDTAWFSMLDSEWPARKRAFERWLAMDNFDPEGRQLHALSSFAG